MRENSRRGAPRSARHANRMATGRDVRARAAGAQGDRRPGQDGRGAVQDGRGAVQDGHRADVTGLTALLEPFLAALELDLEAVRLSTAGRRRVLRIVVDADGGVSLDQIAEVSREVSARLDAKNVMGEMPYTLEVSSPGIDRPLTDPRHWRRAAGRLVRVQLTTRDRRRTAPGAPGTLDGRIIRADPNGVTLEIDGAMRTFGYPELGPGQVQVEFGRLDETDSYFEYADSAAGEGADEEEPRGY